MITRYIWRVLALSVSIDIVFCQTTISITPDVVVVGGSSSIKCETTHDVNGVSDGVFRDSDKTDKIAVRFKGNEAVLKEKSDKKLIPSTFPAIHVEFTSVKCKDARGYTCAYQLTPTGNTQKADSQLTVIDIPKSMTLQATSKCTGNDCSKCGTPAFTGPVVRPDEKMTFECLKEMAFYRNVTNYFKWFIYGSGGWVEQKKTAQKSTTNVNKNVKKGACLTNEISNGTMSYTAKKTDPERMKVKCVAEVHIFGKLKDSKEKLLDMCVLGGDTATKGITPITRGTPTADPLANRGNKNVGGVVVGVVAIAVGLRFY